MTKLLQFYGEPGVPLRVTVTGDEVATAWSSHRARLRDWLADLPETAWTQPTRCSEWNVTALVAHLVSVAQFLGYTLHQANKGIATELMAGFDTQATPAAAADEFSGATPAQLLTALTELDQRIRREIDAWGGKGAWAPAEMPMGTAPACIALNHVFFDSWVHERDLMIPAGERPAIDPDETITVVRYVLGLSGVARSIDEARQPNSRWTVRLTDLDATVAVTTSEVGASAELVDEIDPEHHTVATSGELVDFASGRSAALPAGDPTALAFLHRFARALS